MRSVTEHWARIYARSPVTAVSWYQPEPRMSVQLIRRAGLAAADPIIDVGGGASLLVDRLLESGYHDVTVLDVADDALAVARSRLGTHADRVAWIAGDLLSWQPPCRYRCWHDRAVFHFLTAAADRRRYRQVMHAALAPGGVAVIGTFAADGPTHCSGLPTARYSVRQLAAEFPDLAVARSDHEVHRTPAGAVQPFTWLLLRSAEKTGG